MTSAQADPEGTDGPAGDRDEFVFRPSFAQERLWFLEELQPGLAVYNMYNVVPWSGGIDLSALEAALAALVDRHETLRTRFDVVDEGPVQVVSASARVPLAVTVLEGEPGEARRAAEALALAEASRPFDLRHGPLLRVHVIRIAPAESLLVLGLHHIISDGWSMRVLHRELGAFYAAAAEGRSADLPPLVIQYADFALWQREHLGGDLLRRRLAYWRDRLAGAPATLGLPTDRPRPPVPSYRGALHGFAFDDALARAVRDTAQREGATPFMVLLAAFAAVLARHSGQDDVVVGTPIACRNRIELEGLIGFFANTLALRARVDGRRGFRDLLRAVRETTLSAYEHQDLPFERLVEELRPQRTLNHNPLFQVMFVLDAVDGPGNAAADPGAPSRDFGIGTAKFDLHVSMVDARGSLRGVVEYAEDLFDASTIARLIRHFATLLGAALAAPDAPLARLPLMDGVEREAVLAAARSPWQAGGRPRPVHERVADQCTRNPDAVALRFRDRTITYGELGRRVRRLAQRLAASGVGPGTAVGVHLGRSFDQIVAVLAVLGAGGAYVPLDPAYPERRLAEACAEAELRIVVVGDDPCPFPVEQRVPVDAAPPTDPPALATPTRDALAYVLFTSGSTGRPKGVAMPHGPLADLVDWQHAAAPAPSRVLGFTSLNFDVSAQEIFSTLAAGATLVLTTEEERRDPLALLGRLAQDRVERVFLPASALQALAFAADGRPDLPRLALREIVTAGEQLQVTPHLRRFVERHGIAVLRNQYGPTETHVVSECTLDGPPSAWPDLPPIGRPVAGARLYLLDRDGAPVPDGVEGEIHIGGSATARGYLGRPGETADRFLPDPFADAPGSRMYRSGDMGRRRGDGAIEFLGRRDGQIKVRGFRVELGEIEAVLHDAPGVSEAAAVGAPDPAGGRRLVAHVRMADGVPFDSSALRRHCRTRLPDALVPARFLAVTRLPMTPSGKVDRGALPDPDDAPAPRPIDGAPHPGLEATLAAIWSEVLKVPAVGPNDDFFELGGHSLLATRVVARIRARIGVEVPVRRLFEAPTVRDLASLILAEELARAEPAGPAGQPADGDP